jgi:H+-translocating NAD(P) transhydrogenase subunit alpha
MNSIVQFVSENLIMLYLLVFTVVLGFELISKVPTVLHTPLMSGANAISGIVLIGAILLIRSTNADDFIKMSLGAAAIVLAVINIVGGFGVTNRMLSMFNKKKK